MFDTTPKFFEPKFSWSRSTGSASRCKSVNLSFFGATILNGCNFGTAGRILLKFGTHVVYFFHLKKFFRGVKNVFFEDFLDSPTNFFRFLKRAIYAYYTPKFHPSISKDLVETKALQS